MCRVLDFLRIQRIILFSCLFANLVSLDEALCRMMLRFDMVKWTADDLNFKN